MQHISEIIPAWFTWKQEQWKAMNNKKLRPSEGFIEKICVECAKPVLVPLKTFKSKWGKNDWRHKECHLKSRKFQKYAW